MRLLQCRRRPLLGETKTEAQAEFQREVLEVNREFAEGYAHLYHREGFDAVTGVSRSPRTDFNPGRAPQIGAGSEIDPRARAVGDVRLGANGTVDERAAIRADEARRSSSARMPTSRTRSPSTRSRARASRSGIAWRRAA